MPGPKSSPTPGFKFPVGKPNRKAAARLKARQDAYSRPNNKYSGGYHMPGSQNPSK